MKQRTQEYVLSVIAFLTPCFVYAEEGMGQELVTVRPSARTEDWWVQRHTQKLDEVSASADVELVMIGDSITHAWETEGQDVFAKFYGERKTLNLGYSGDRTEHVLWRIQHGELDGLAPKVVVIMIGTNNTGHRQDKPAETVAGIEAILDEVQTRLPAAKILLLAVFPRGATPDDPLRTLNRGINDRLAEFAADDAIEYLDVGQAFLTDDGALKKELMPDLLHPVKEGYALWAAAMEPKLAEMLGGA